MVVVTKGQMMYRIPLGLAWLLLFSSLAYAGESAFLDRKRMLEEMPGLEWLLDKSGELDPLTVARQGQFQAYDSLVYVGLKPNWIRLTVPREAGPQDFWLSADRIFTVYVYQQNSLRHIPATLLSLHRIEQCHGCELLIVSDYIPRLTNTISLIPEHEFMQSFAWLTLHTIAPKLIFLILAGLSLVQTVMTRRLDYLVHGLSQIAGFFMFETWRANFFQWTPALELHLIFQSLFVILFAEFVVQCIGQHHVPRLLLRLHRLGQMAVLCIPFLYRSWPLIWQSFSFTIVISFLIATLGVLRLRGYTYWLFVAWLTPVLGYVSTWLYAFGYLKNYPEHAFIYSLCLDSVFFAIAIAVANRSELLASLHKSEELYQQSEQHKEDLEKQLFQIQTLAQAITEQEKARTHFFNNISHELRTPLNGIIGFTELVREQEEARMIPQNQQRLERVVRLAESLKLQVNTILDLAKLKRGSLELKSQFFPLRALADELAILAEGLSAASDQQFFKLEIEFHEENFVGDFDKILTVGRNLIGNAFKFRRPEGLHQVKLRLKTDQKGLSITVKDNGIGIAKADLSRIFLEFEQAQKDERRRYEGSGLGLAMVRELLNLMQGSLEVDSDLDEGTEFRIWIPVGDAHQATQILASFSVSPSKALNELNNVPASSPALPEANKPLMTVGDAKVLVVDDNPINCEVIVGVLVSEGFQVQATTRAQECLALLQSFRPDLLLLDMMMPEMSGRDVLELIKQDDTVRDIPVILITAKASDSDRIEGLALGVDDYLTKPFMPQELRLRVRNIIERSHLLREIERNVQDDKLLQMGSLFAELSHELKNILYGGQLMLPLEAQDSLLSSAVLSLSDAVREIYVKALIQKPSAGTTEGLLKQLKQSVSTADPVRYQTVYSMFTLLALELEEAMALQKELLALDTDELEYARSQIKLFRQYAELMQILARCNELSLSVLAYTRHQSGQGQSDLQEVWDKSLALVRPRLKHLGIQVQGEVSPETLPISLSSILQVFVNLLNNAIDAVQGYPQAEKWITLQYEWQGHNLQIDIANGGPPIPEAVQSKLFGRGFSTKGEKGSGIGLFASRRILHEVGGELLYVKEASHPLMRIVLRSAAAKCGL